MKPRKRTFKNRLIVSYILIILLPFLSCWTVYAYLLGNMRRQAYAYCEEALSKSVASMDSLMKDYMTFIDLIETNPSYISLAKQSDSKDTLDNEIELAKFIKQSKSNFPRFETLIYFFKSDCLFSEDGLLPLKGAYHEYIFFDGMDGVGFENLMRNQRGYMLPIQYSGARVAYKDKQDGFLLFTSLPVNARENTIAAITILADKQAAMRNFDNFLQFGDIRLDIELPNAAEPLSFKSGAVTNAVKFSEKSPINNWIYTVSLNRDRVVNNADNVRILFGFLIFLCALVSIFMIHFLAGRNARPIQTLTRGFNMTGRDELEVLRNVVNNAELNEKRLADYMRQNVTVIKNSFINRMLSDSDFSADEITRNIVELGLKMSGKQFCVVLLRLDKEWDSFRETQIACFALREALEDVCSTEIIEEGAGKYICVFAFAEEDESANMLIIETAAHAIEKVFAEDFSGYLRVIQGEFCNNLSRISVSYRRAAELERVGAVTQQGKILWVTESEEVNEGWYYPFTLEAAMMNCLKSGDDVKTEEIFGEIRRENYEKRLLSLSQMDSLAYEMRGSLVKCIDETNLPRERIGEVIKRITDVNWRDFTYDEYEKVVRIFLELARTVKLHRRQMNADKLETFIIENYGDPSFGRPELAKHLNVTEEYASSIFKDIMGETFSRYLENYRMKIAKEMIIAGKKNINEIADLTGYASSASFRRTFKKCVGISPSAFKSDGKRI